MADLDTMTDRELAREIRMLDDLLEKMAPADSPYSVREIDDATTRYLDLFTEFVQRMMRRKRIGVL